MKLNFWHSEKHAEHYARIGDVPRNSVALETGRSDYTCCSARPKTQEPYDGAFEAFPDYKFIGTATIDDIRAEGKW